MSGNAKGSEGSEAAKGFEENAADSNKGSSKNKGSSNARRPAKKPAGITNWAECFRPVVRLLLFCRCYSDDRGVNNIIAEAQIAETYVLGESEDH